MLSAAYCHHILQVSLTEITTQNQPDIVIIRLMLSVSLCPNRCTRVENPGGEYLKFLPRGQGSQEKLQGGPPILGFILLHFY